MSVEKSASFLIEERSWKERTEVVPTYWILTVVAQKTNQSLGTIFKFIISQMGVTDQNLLTIAHRF